MSLNTIIGSILILGIIIAAIFFQGGMETIMQFVNLPSFMIVIGCTVGATLINFKGGEILSGLKSIKHAIKPKKLDPQEIIDYLTKVAVKARKEGFVSIRNENTGGNHPLIDTGLALIADGADPDVIRSVLETQSFALQKDVSADERFWRDMSVYLPLFGMTGTLIGLILMLRTLDNPSRIGPGMAIALLTTLYGIVLAGICMPIAGKIKNFNNLQTLMNTAIIEGILSIQSGDNSQIVGEKLKSYF